MAMPLPRRFDDALMQPPAAGAAVDAALLRRLRTWCEAGAWPALTLPLAVACSAPHDGLDAVACELDGSHALARLGRWRGWAWRLQLQLRERLPGHAPRPTDPWDCGWWRDGALAAATAFRPRRPTLLLLREAAAPAAPALLAALQAQQAHYARPLRVLLVGAAPRPGVPRL